MIKTTTQPLLRLVIDNEREADDSEGNEPSGYRSARSTCLDTPEIDSTGNTLFGGNPLRSHFSTAWRDTPQRLASPAMPPGVESIANCTGLGSEGPGTSTFESFIRPTMQPIVALCQQPMRARQPRRMQLMVVRTKEEAREEFSRNLNSALDKLGAPKRGRPDWLRTKIGNLVSRESCRKWLFGLDIPDQANLSVLVSTLDLNAQQLLTGEWEMPPGSQDSRLTALTKIWPELEDKTREAIMSVLSLDKSAVKSQTDSKSPSTSAQRPRRRRA